MSVAPVSGDTNYPPGVTGAEDVFYDEDAPCNECGHLPDDHDDGTGWCQVVVASGTPADPHGTPVRIYCPCEQYEPFEEEPHGY